ncbi:hypothetical protein LSH36_201g05055 [Paralvinella palmiformis]|uniref:Uncharacterized protein n=1 Tax=Paralvinella palmiformis TaxID=53620 RepID=A0AAD9JQY9_9ANNE|nr:hypothetical protein LSH36_201g05055 [Paralvinella palmiformis]
MDLKNSEEKVGNSGYIAIMQQVSEVFSAPELNSQIHMYQAILQTATAFMDSKTNRTLPFPEVLPISPQIHGIVQLMMNLPEVLSTVSVSYQTLDFQKLLKLNFTTAAKEICQPNNVLESFFTFPKNVDVDQLKHYFCSINISSLLSEIYMSDLNIGEMIEQSTANSTAIINSVLSAMVKSIGQFLDRLQHSNVTLEQITGNNTLLLDYLKLSYKAPIELTKALLHAVINKPEELLTFFMNLAQSENSLQFFCNHSVTNLLAMFQIPADVDLTSVYNTQCDMNLTALGEEAGNMLGIKTVIVNLQQAITDGQFSTLQFNESELVADYQRLISKLQEIVRDGITFQQPEPNHFTVLTLFKELLVKYSNIEDTSAMMKLYGSMVKILLSVSQSGYSLDKYFRAVQIILDYFTKLLQQLDVHNGIIQLLETWNKPPAINTEELYASYNNFVAELVSLINVTEVDFFGTSLTDLAKERNISWSLVFDTLRGELVSNPEQLINYLVALKNLDTVLKGNKYWARTKAALAGAQMFMDVLSGKIQQWPVINETVKDLLKNASYTSDYIQRMFAVAPDVVNIMLSVKIDWVQFYERKMNSDFKLDWKSYLDSVTQFKDVMKRYFEAVQFSDVPVFFLYDGNFSSWLSQLQQAFSLSSLSQKSTTPALIENIISSMLTGLSKLTEHGDTINLVAAELVDSMKTIVNVINKWLKTKFAGGTIKLLDLLGNSTEIYNIVKSTLEIQPVVIQTLLNAEMSPELYLLLVGNTSSANDIICNSTSFSDLLKLEPNASISFNSLQMALCKINSTILFNQLQDVWDIRTLIATFTRLSQLSHITKPHAPNHVDVGGLIEEWQKLIEQSGKLLQQPINASGLFESFNITRFIHGFDNILQQDMTKIIMRSVKSGLAASLSFLPTHARNQFRAILRTVNEQFQVLTAYDKQLMKTVCNILCWLQNFKWVNTSVSKYGVIELGEELDRTWSLYQSLSEMGYFNASLDPQSLLMILQQPDMYNYIIKELRTTPGAAIWWPKLESSLSVLNTIAAYFSGLLAKDSISRLLSSALTPTSAKFLLLISINPSLFSKVLDQESFIQLVCNSTEFQQMFNMSSFKPYESVQLQIDICEAATSHKLLIQQMFNILDMQHFYTKNYLYFVILQITSTPTEKDNIVSNSWRQIENLVTNIQYLITSGQNDTRSLHDWLADVERMAVQMQQDKNSSLAHYVDVCDTTVWSLELLYPGNIIDNLHWSEIILETTLFSLQSINDVENLVCILPSMNVTQLIRYWNSSRISEIVKMYFDIHSGNNKTKSFSCDRYIATVTEIVSEYENIQSLLPEFWNRVVNCLSKSSKSNATAFTEINRIIDIWKMANQLLTVSPDLKGLFPEGGILLFENFYRAFIEEKPVMVMLEKLWKNSTEVKKSAV